MQYPTIMDESLNYIRNYVDKNYQTKKAIRKETIINIFYSLIRFYQIDINNYISMICLKDFSIRIENKQYEEIFYLRDYLNNDLFQSRLRFTLLNKDEKFHKKVNINSKHFQKTKHILKVNNYQNHTGFGFMNVNDNNNFYIGEFENGWMVGDFYYYDRYFNKTFVKDIDKCFDRYCESLLD